jgi:hypothetical protein
MYVCMYVWDMYVCKCCLLAGWLRQGARLLVVVGELALVHSLVISAIIYNNMMMTHVKTQHIGEEELSDCDDADH